MRTQTRKHDSPGKPAGVGTGSRAGTNSRVGTGSRRLDAASLSNRRAGLTLIEVLVAAVILVAIIMIVNSLLTSAQRSVNIAQKTTSANADARAISDRLREDLAGLTREGFLAIVSATDFTPPLLIFTTVGPYRTRGMTYPDVRANAAVICYSIRRDSSDDDSLDVLVREANLLALVPGEKPGDWTDDVMNRYLADMAPYRREDWAWNKIVQYRADSYLTINSAPNSVSQVYNLWPMLAKPVENFSVEWTDDGTTWNGFHKEWNQTQGRWDLVISPDLATLSGFDKDDDGQVHWIWGNGAYEAMWSARRKDLWPIALRISYSLGKGESARSYEVIVNLPG